ncbi:uncharacterized protein LOC135467708 [Liolophura sinensis]|uniref:uncharacterized protein LOC135467708 n=1 Tax=Liolophura sinensis TaxID=3198878 RepID=UPI0031597DC4
MERELFLTDYLRVNHYKVLQLEVHPLNLSPVQSRPQQKNVIWFADRHLQEIVQLVKDIAIKRSSLAAKEAMNTTSQLLTGQTVRLGYAFREKKEHQSCLILRDNLPYSDEFSEGKKAPMSGRYRNYQVHREKMVIYVLPLEKGRPSGVQKILSALNDEKKMQVEISDYFVRSPRSKDPLSPIKVPLTEDNTTETGVKSLVPADSTSLEPDASLAQRSQSTEDLILIEDSDSVDWVVGQDRKESNHTAVKEDKQMTIKHTLQKCTNKLSKQYKRKAKLTQKPAECVQPVGDLPDIQSYADNNKEWLSVKDSSETNQVTGDSEFQTKPYGVMEAFAAVAQKKQLSKNLKTGRAMIGSDSESDVSHRLPLRMTKKSNKLKTKTIKNHTDNIEHFENDNDNEILVCESGTSTSPMLKKNVKKTSLFSQESDNDNNEEKKRKLSGSCENRQDLRKSIKLSRLAKGMCSKECESEPMSPSMKHCSVPLTKLSETSQRDSNTTSTTIIRKGKCARPSNKRISKRISEVFQQCEKIAELIDLDSDAEVELEGILQESKSHTQLMKDEDHIEAMWKVVRSVKELSNLSAEELIFLVHQNEDYLRNIFQGKIFCQRHQDYKAGGSTRKRLMYQVYFGAFTDEQGDLVMDSLLSIFCKKHKKYLDYLMKVLLPEMFVKIYMDVRQVNHEEARAMIQAS